MHEKVLIKFDFTIQLVEYLQRCDVGMISGNLHTRKN